MDTKQIPGLWQRFEKPSAKYGLVPFWTWNGAMKESRMVEQMQAMKDQGIREFIVMAFWPLSIPYCEGEWWDRIDLALKYCRENDMRMWIYDEYSWPSGACGGKLLRDKPWTRNVVMGYLSLDVAPGEFISQPIDGHLIAANALMANGEIIDVLHLMKTRSEQGDKTTAVVEWRNTFDSPVKVYLFVRNVTDELLNFGLGASWSWMQRGYVNTLDRRAIEAFIETTYEEYAKRYSDYFGREIVGFFTDEPALSYYGSTYGGTAFPYTDGLFETFRERYGYDLRSRLPELLQDMGEFRKTRHDYWSLVTSIFTNSYHRTLREWCDRHGLMLTGHPVWEESIGWNIIHSGDIYEGNKWYHAPGFDLLQTDTSYSTGFMENSIHIGIAPRALAVTAKIEGSTARHAGSSRMLCEAYGVGSWALTMEDQRKATDWITAFGTNLIVDCMMPYSTHGLVRYRACGKNFYSPWWKYYSLFNAYAARMAAIAGECVLKAEIGVMFPMSSAWCQFNEQLRQRFILVPENRDTQWGMMQESLYFVTDALLRSHWDYEYVFDGMFAESRVEQGRFVAPHSAYSVLLLPGVTTLTPKEMELIKAFAESGGKLVLVSEVPRYCSDGTLDVRNEMEQLLKLKNVIFVPHSVALDNNVDELDAVMRGLLPKEVTIVGEHAREILKAHRIWKEQDIVLLANQSDQFVRCEITMSGSGAVEMWDPFSGRRYATGLDVSNRTLGYEFAPHESLFLVAEDFATEYIQEIDCKSWRRQTILEKQALEGAWEFSLESGNMFLPDWMVRPDIGGTGEEYGWQNSVDDEGWNKTEWSKSDIQLNPDDMACYWLKTEIVVESVPKRMGLLGDTSEEYPAVFVNGKKISERAAHTLWDPENVWFDIADCLTVGKNLIVVQAKIPARNKMPNAVYMADLTDVAPVVVMGDFAMEDGRIQAAEKPRKDMAVGSWHLQGYQNYAGTGVYAKDLDIETMKQGERLWLDLGKPGDVAEVWMNGRHVATLPFHPYEADLTDHVVEGMNCLEIKVTNNFGNLLFGCWCGRVRHFTPAGLLEEPMLIRTSGAC